MQFQNIDNQLKNSVEATIEKEVFNWLEAKITAIVLDKSVKDLYLTYSLVGVKVSKDISVKMDVADAFSDYVKLQSGNAQQIARVYFLRRILKANSDFFAPKVAKIIEVADTNELETFLKFLILLPNPEYYKSTAVEALRTNVSTVFNAIAHFNPYPGKFFNDQQWNQMYLKTAFMQGDLNAILDIDKRANKDLARIISDYAHERWAAGRDIDPYFWRPVPKFLEGELIKDMERLLKSNNAIENKAGALCCYYSENATAKHLLTKHEALVQKIESKDLSWETLKKV